MVRVGGISRAVLPRRLLGTSPKHQDVPYRTEGQACSGNGTPPTLQPIFHFCLLCERPSWHLSHCGSGPRPGSRASHSCLVPSVIFHLAQVLSKERKKCLFCMTLIFLKNTGKLLRRWTLSLGSDVPFWAHLDCASQTGILKVMLYASQMNPSRGKWHSSVPGQCWLFIWSNCCLFSPLCSHCFYPCTKKPFVGRHWHTYF